MRKTGARSIWKSREFRMLSIFGAILVVGIVSAGFMAVSIQKATLYSITEFGTEKTANIVLKDIETTMLEGKADITRKLVRHITEIKGIEEITVLNSEGKEAFREDSPVLEAPVLLELKSGRERILMREGSRLSIYMPLKNSPECRRCHGAEKQILGAVKVSVSIEKEYRKAMALITVVIVITIVASLVLSVIFWLMLRKMIISPIRSLESAAEKIAAGDLRFDVDLRGDDEIGMLSRSFKESFGLLGGVFQRIKDLSGRISKVAEDVGKESESVVRGAEVEVEAIGNISNAVEELNAAAVEIAENTEGLAASTEETSVSMEQMASSIGTVNNNMHDLSSAVEATSSSIEELSATIKEVAANAEELARASDETLSAVSEITSAIREVDVNAKESARQSEKVTSDAVTFGMTSIEKTINGMKNIKSSVERTAEFVRKLGGRSDEIGKILNVIDDVTDQTTLLALNAAILAAQAGEHGKGFSVVAEEIKDLAERAAFSTQEIAGLIQSVQQEVRNAVEAMQQGLGSVEEGFRLAKEAGDALGKIVESSKISSEMSRSIERSTTEQSKAAKLVTEAMERVRNMVDQIAKATAEESKGILLIMKATEKMRDVSRQVSSATEEQAISSRQISLAMELAAERSQQISRSLSEHKIGAKHIMNVVDGVKGIPSGNQKLAFRINNALKDLLKDSELLRTEMERFKFDIETGSSIRFGVLPLETPAVMFRKFSPLAGYLSSRLGRPVELKVAGDFESALKDIGQNRTQLCAMGPVTYVEAYRTYGVKVLVRALRNGRPFHHAVVITRADSDIKSLSDLRGKSFAFGDVRSSTGYVIPRAMLKEAGIGTEDLKNYEHLAHHDDVAMAVLKGDFDAGGVMESTAYKFRDKGLRFLGISDDIPEFNICYNTSLDPRDVNVIKKSLLSLSISNAEDAEILRSLGSECTGFIEADDSDYDGIRRKMARAGLYSREM